MHFILAIILFAVAIAGSALISGTVAYFVLMLFGIHVPFVMAMGIGFVISLFLPRNA